MQQAVINKEGFAAARRASNLSLEKAAELCGLARQTYANREERPGDFRLSELINVYAYMNEPGRRILRDSIGSIFLP